MKATRIVAGIVATVFAIGGCGSADDGEGRPARTTAEPAGELTPEQMEKGIGPVTSVSLGDLDDELAEQGHAVFSLKCAACHKLTERYVGPPLGGVLERRTPEFVMNMILNPAEMVEKHPDLKALLAQYMTPMPNQQLTQEEARAVLEYLRSAAAAAPGN